MYAICQFIENMFDTKCDESYVLTSCCTGCAHCALLIANNCLKLCEQNAKRFSYNMASPTEA